MKAIVAYMSESGGTRRVAEAIFDEIEAEKQILNFTEVDDLGDCDLAFVGFPLQNFGAPPEAKRFLEQHCADRWIALFVTHAAPESTSATLQAWLAACREAAAGAHLVGMFDCQAELAPGVKQAMLAMDDPEIRRWAQMDSSLGQPDGQRLAAARAFARKTISDVTVGGAAESPAR